MGLPVWIRWMEILGEQVLNPNAASLSGSGFQGPTKAAEASSLIEKLDEVGFKIYQV